VDYNRGELKRSVKSIIRQTKPSPLLITLVYLLVAAVVPMIVDLFTSPTMSLMSNMNTFSQMMDSGDTYLAVAYLSSMLGDTIGIGMLVSIFMTLFTTVMSFGYNWYCLKMVRGDETSFGDIFSGFAQAGWVILMNFLIAVFVCLWSLLVGVGAVILIFLAALTGSDLVIGLVAVVVYLVAIVLIVFIALRYAMAPFILIDNPGIGALEPIRRSKEMMKGQKRRLFVLGLSFIGWYLLVGLIVSIVMCIGMAIGGMSSFMTDNSDSVQAITSFTGSVGITTVIAYILTLPLMMWLQAYATGATAQFYNLLTNAITREIPPMNSNFGSFGGQQPYENSQRRPMSDYEPKTQAPSTPGYDPEKNAPTEKPQAEDVPQSEEKPNDDIPQ
jgi:uncharacterized membrane protein